MTEYAPAKTGEYPSDIPQSSNDLVSCKEYLSNNKHNSLHLAGKYAQIFFPLDIICSSKLTVCLLEQIMSADKYHSIFFEKRRLLFIESTCKFDSSRIRNPE